jgi:hypothetical protein
MCKLRRLAEHGSIRKWRTKGGNIFWSSYCQAIQEVR